MKCMEAMQDKIIREKLNSLDTLPEGYAPSLDSKWELLNTGKPEKKKEKPLYLWYAAAASVLLLLCFGLTYFQFGNKALEKGLAVENIPNKGVIQKSTATVPEPESAINETFR